MQANQHFPNVASGQRRAVPPRHWRSTAAALAIYAVLGSAATYAGEGNGDVFAFRAPGSSRIGSGTIVQTDTGSAAYPAFIADAGWVAPGPPPSASNCNECALRFAGDIVGEAAVVRDRLPAALMTARAWP